MAPFKPTLGGGGDLQVIWEEAAKKIFESLSAAVPKPLKELAQDRVRARLEIISREKNLSRVGIPEVVAAFRWETPGMYRTLITAKIKELGLEEYWTGHE